MYFGLAFSRVGLDFRVLIVTIFEEAILEQMKKSLLLANSKFEESLAKLNWSELYIENSKMTNSSLLSTFDENFKTNISATSIINPPIQLLDFQPLAIYLNCILSAFNEFRLCGPLNLFGKVNYLVSESLLKLSSHLNGYYKKEKASFDKNESDLFFDFLHALAHVLIPFVERCLTYLFSHEQLQKVFNFSQSDLDKLKAAQKFDIQHLMLDLFELVPVKKEAEPISVLAQNESAESKAVDIESTKVEVSLDQEIHHNIPPSVNAENLEI